MKPRTIHHPEALADWRANDEKHYNPHSKEVCQQRLDLFRNLQKEKEAENNATTETHDNTLSQKQEDELEQIALLAWHIKKAIERENRKRGTVRKEREA